MLPLSVTVQRFAPCRTTAPLLCCGPNVDLSSRHLHHHRAKSLSLWLLLQQRYDRIASISMSTYTIYIVFRHSYVERIDCRYLVLIFFLMLAAGLRVRRAYLGWASSKMSEVVAATVQIETTLPPNMAASAVPTATMSNLMKGACYWRNRCKNS